MKPDMGKRGGMPYARVEYIPGAPGVKVSKFKLGSGQYDSGLRMVSHENVLLRQEAIEAARVAINSVLQKKLGEGNYVLRVIAYPHVILRRHEFLAAAGADRLSQGMRRAYGKPSSRAAHVPTGGVVFEVYSRAENLNVLREALKRGTYKLPMNTGVEPIQA
jgi:large subunit ribosomal protein L10e